MLKTTFNHGKLNDNRSSEQISNFTPNYWGHNPASTPKQVQLAGKHKYKLYQHATVLLVLASL